MKALRNIDFMINFPIWYHVAVKKPNFREERKLWNKGVKYIIGIDEVGRGAFAGPLVAAGVVFPKINKITKKTRFLKEINDSKKVDAKERKRLSKRILKYALHYAIEEIDIETINKIGIGKANHLIIKKVAKTILSQLNDLNHFILCDGLSVQKLKKNKAIVDGDCKSITIAAASIIAKVHRDSLMRGFSKKFHHYKLSRNKGYGTKGHQEAIKKFGLSQIHRTSFDLNKFLSQSI